MQVGASYSERDMISNDSEGITPPTKRNRAHKVYSQNYRNRPDSRGTTAPGPDYERRNKRRSVIASRLYVSLAGSSSTTDQVNCFLSIAKKRLSALRRFL